MCQKVIEEHYQAGRLPQNAASVVFKVPNKAAGKKLTEEMWVAGNKFKALAFIPNRTDTLGTRCCQWGHAEAQCHSGGKPVCGISSVEHRTETHMCEVATCGKIGKVCAHAVMRYPNCKGNHPVQDARCKVKIAAIWLAHGG